MNNLILFSGTASIKIEKELKKLRVRRLRIVSGIKSMQRAVKRASELAEIGDIVLLSPAAASFNLFKNEFDRGEQFNKIIKRL